MLRCASKVTPAFASDGTLWLAWMAGGQISVASSSDAGPQLFDAGSGDEGEAQPRLGAGCASPDRRREKRRHRTGVFAVQGQGVQRPGARHASRLMAAKALPSRSRSRRATRASVSWRSASMLTVRCFPPGSTSGTGCRRSRKARNTRGQGCSSRRRKTVALLIPRRNWPPTTPANAAGSDWPSPVPAVPWSCSGTSLRAACGITRS